MFWKGENFPEEVVIATTFGFTKEAYELIPSLDNSRKGVEKCQYDWNIEKTNDYGCWQLIDHGN